MGLISGALLMIPAGGLAQGQTDPAGAEASPGQVPGAPSNVTRGRAVAIVLAADPRFAGLADYETLRRRTQGEFRPYVLDTSYDRVLPDVAADMVQFGFTARTPASWLISVTLVSDCVEPSPAGPSPAADPCAWRHTWTYRVTPDASLMLLFDEGDPAADAPAPTASLLKIGSQDLFSPLAHRTLTFQPVAVEG